MKWPYDQRDLDSHNIEEVYNTSYSVIRANMLDLINVEDANGTLQKNNYETFDFVAS